MESTFNYIPSASFKINCRRSILDTPMPIINPVELGNIRLVKKGEMKFKVTI